jgi:hypothetical protein
MINSTYNLNKKVLATGRKCQRARDPRLKSNFGLLIWEREGILTLMIERGKQSKESNEKFG